MTSGTPGQPDANDPTDSPAPGRGLFGLLVDRPVFALMITVAMVLVGIMSLSRLPLTFMGDGMTWGTANIWIPINSARSPREAEEKVAKPAEELFRTIPGLRSVRCSCDSTGVRFRLELNSDLNPVLASAEIRDRLQRAMLQFPEGVDRYFTWREDGSSPPLHFFQILTPQNNAEWQDKVENVVTPRLEAVDGVGRVDMFGLLKESIRIRFDRDKLTAHRVDYRGLMQRLAQDNYTEPAGEIDNQSERLLLRIDSKFHTIDDIENFPIRPGLRIKDVAEVARDRKESDSYSRFNQRFTFTGSIRGASGVNPVETSHRVRETTEELKQDPRLAGIDFRFLFDQGEFIENSLNNLLEASFKGGALALLVLLLFLRNLRATFAIGLAIPLTLLIVADYLYFTGGSLNILSMTGMTLAVGMVVDNSVVVLENIRRLRAGGMPLRHACIQGAQEMGLAVTMATLTTVAVFMPVIFMSSGKTRALMGSLGGPLSVALIGSLFIALVLLPSGIRQLGGMRPPKATGWKIWSPIEALTRGTLRSLDVLMRHRYKVLAGCVVYVVLISTGILGLPFPRLDFETGDQNPFRASDVSIRMQLPKGLSDEDVHKEAEFYENALLAKKEEWKIKSISCRYSRRSVRLDLQLADEVKAKDYASFGKRIRAGIPRRAGVKAVIRGQEDDSGEEDDARNFVIRIRGRDSEHLGRLGLKLQTILVERPEVEMAEVSSVQDNQEVIVQVDRDRLQELGVGPEVLFGTLSGGLQGRELTRFEEGGREVRLVSQFADKEEPTMGDLRETQVFSSKGNFQRLGDLSDVRFRSTLDSIERRDGKTTITVLGRRSEGVGPAQFSNELGRIMSTFPMPRGYSWAEDSIAQQTAAQVAELAQAGILSVVLVFLLMAILFESVILPGAILVTILVSTFGGMWSLKIFHGSIDPMAITGLILLAGVVVNNGIVLLDCIERLRRNGMARDEAIREGIRIRLRPIVMTAMTTIVGLLPMAIFGESTGQGISYVSMSITVSGGLALCTLLTAASVSLAYSWLDDLSNWLHSTLRRALRGAGSPAASQLVSSAKPQSL